MNLTQSFKRLDDLLVEYQSYWNFVPFEQTTVPWNNAQLDALLSQTNSTSKIAENIFPKVHNWLNNSEKQTGVVNENWQKEVPFWLTNGIHGRKIEQIKQLCSHIKPIYPVLEWCAGKGHLGRLLSFQHQCKVVSAEWQSHLCQQGAELAHKYQIPQKFIHTNVLQDPLNFIEVDQHIVALHACGDLHVTLLKHMQKVSSKQLHLAPCCYHLIAEDSYAALSQAGQASSLNIKRNILKLAVQAQVTGGKRITELRRKEVLWRLAYQALRADISGQTAYASLPSVNKSWFSGEFNAFAKWGLNHQNLQQPDFIDDEYYLEIGQEKALFTQKLESVRHVFQRALEYWLVLDKAIYLQDLGYQVKLKAFCDYHTTPRNLMIIAKRSDG
ncbi:methyltransferase [Catenovulum sediminis]|uniref:methyltransferase n=1 Tax=Catenovulum sediminis TaxID=1740262 RepID=UPI00117DCB40|nr:methyltransferase [Catenovulum sediminis]